MLEGGCHCGAVRFRVDWPITELTTCDCSLCVKRNAVMAKVPEQALIVLQGEAMLRLYEWNTRRAKHYFCGRCGIYTFHRKRAAPDHYGVNVFCLEGFDASSVPVRAAEGANMTIEDPNPRPEWPGPRGDGGKVPFCPTEVGTRPWRRKETAVDLSNATIGQLMIPVEDFDRGVSFYKDTLGLPFLFAAPPQMAFFMCGSIRILVGVVPAGQTAQRGSAIYFRVEDIRGVASSLAAKDVEFMAEPHLVHRTSTSELWLAEFRDPDGNHLALMSEIPVAAPRG